MTQEQIEGNKIIAEFMEGSLVKDHSILDDDKGATWMRLKRYEVGKFGYYEINDLKFHSSFDWLMPVVEKIGKLSPFTIYEKGMRISDAGVVCKLYDSLIENIWNAVILYIKFYNQNKQQ